MKFLNLKNLSLASIAILTVFTISCNKDDEPDLTNQLLYNDQIYEVRDGLVLEFGVLGSHTVNNFIATDGDISVVNQNDTIFVGLSNFSYTLDLILWSPNPTTFVSGDYEFFGGANIEGRFFFEDGNFATDLNQDGDSDDPDEVFLLVTGGTIRVDGASPNFTLVYNLTLEDGKVLKGNFSGPWESLALSEAYLRDDTGNTGLPLKKY